MTSSPTPPDPSQGATDLDNGGNLPNPQAPSRVGVGFPSGAVTRLRALREPRRDDLDEVLAWIDRYVPQSLVGSEETVVVDGIRELRFNGDEAILDMLDLVRVNGRPFVPETAVLAEPPALPSRDDIASVLFRQRGTAHDWEDAIEADPESAAGTLASICRDDADAVLALIENEGHNPDGFVHATHEQVAVIADAVRLYVDGPTPPVNHEAVNRERAGVTGKTLFERMSDIARAARPAFACPQCGYDMGHPGTSREGVCEKCRTSIVVELNKAGDPVALARRA